MQNLFWKKASNMAYFLVRFTVFFLREIFNLFSLYFPTNEIIEYIFSLLLFLFLAQLELPKIVI